tara:strand:- start:299 stop:499 length:201 start_codon:yes stop_codon:yes gene_type:complete
MSILKFFGWGAAATGTVLIHLAVVSAVVLPMDSQASRKGLGEFIQASLALTVVGAACGSIGAVKES